MYVCVCVRECESERLSGRNKQIVLINKVLKC